MGKLVPTVAHVDRIDTVTNGLRRVRVHRPEELDVTPGTHVAVRVEPGFGPFGTWRRYTVSRADDDCFELVAFLHGDGPGTRFLRGLESGQPIGLRWSDPPMVLPAGTPAVVVADESAIGTVTALLCHARQRATVVLHVADPGDAAPLAYRCDIDLLAHVAPPHDRTGLVTALERTPAGSVIVAVGQRDTVREVRRWARTARPNAVVQHRTYWAPGRTGLE